MSRRGEGGARGSAATQDATPGVINLRANALVLLVGPAGSGKSTFARRHFGETQIVSSDRCRALVGDDEADQTVNTEAFALLRTLVRLRLRLGRLTVVDSTALQWRQRRSLLGLGRACGAPVAALVFDVDAATCKRRNLSRKRRVPEDVIDLHRSQLLRVLQTIFSEGFDAVRILDRVADEQVEVGAEG